MLRQSRIFLWRVAAVITFLLGAAGIVLPVVPTVPFWIVSAWAAGKGWPALETWLLNHATYGPSIRKWREHGIVPRRAKWVATTTMAISAIVLQFGSLSLWLKAGAPALMVGVAIWLWSRPEDEAR
jgi:uncharacterized protein